MQMIKPVIRKREDTRYGGAEKEKIKIQTGHQESP